ncbi:hypothetical protein B0H11DRAFT_1861793 [Mycena galericulata]|nr:hypothetical protein B0H11DRAFT_1861793 [Mycena galericulata]
MGEIALINFDKREVIDPSETGHGFKMCEAIMNWMPVDAVWLFTVPADGQNAPTPPGPAAAHWTIHGASPARVPVGHWAGDRVLIADEYCGSAAQNFPADLLAAYPGVDPEDSALEFALANLKHVGLPGYEHAGAKDALFPQDRVWVVRNLTQSWYARSDVLVSPKNRRGPDISGGLGFGDLIWADIGGAMSATVKKGSYGERFDIQPLEVVQNPDDRTKWEDLSKKAKSCLIAFDMDHDVQQHRGGEEEEEEED